MTAAGERRRGYVLLAIMAALFMVAIEATIVATAMPQIVGSLGGLQLYAWVFSSFLLTQTATTVVFGKLSDQFGRKPTLLAGIAIFLAGSLLCGFAWSMTSLIIFRLVQGFGAGAIQPVCLTIVGDLYPGSERGKAQAYLSSAFGISAVLGPLAGGLIVQNMSWAWIFWINIPLGLLAMAGILVFLDRDAPRTATNVDVWGAVLFTVAVSTLMYGLSLSSQPQRGLEAALMAMLFALSCGLFVRQERRAAEPIISFALWKRRTILAANAASLLAGMTVIGLTTFLPMLVQGVLRESAIVAGFALTVMVLGWPASSIVAARNLTRFGLRPTLISGAMLLPVGSIAFILLPGIGNVLTAGAGSLIVGIGMGLMSTASIVLIQDSVSRFERGSATASYLFARNLGSTLGATLMGAVFNIGLARHQLGGDTKSLNDVLSGAGSGTAASIASRGLLAIALQPTFLAIFATAAICAAVTFLVPVSGLRTAEDE